MRRPGICIVGCGQIGSAHARRLGRRARLWFHNRSPKRAEVLNRSVGGEGVFDDLSQALEDERVEAVMITTPPETHAAFAIQALHAGKMVFVEKPLCTSRAEVDAISDAADGAPVMVGENYYYKPSLNLVKQWIDEGAIGKLREMKVRKCFSQPSSGWKSDHGALFEGGIHFVALINGLLGGPASVVSARFPSFPDRSPERHAVVEMSHDLARIELAYSWETPSPTKGVFQHSTIAGDEGRIVFETNGMYARLSGRRSEMRFPGFRDMMGAGAMIDDFLRMIETGQPPISDLAHARQDLETVFTAYEMGGMGPF